LPDYLAQPIASADHPITTSAFLSPPSFFSFCNFPLEESRMVPDSYTELVGRIEKDLAAVEGWLSHRETRFLTLLAASPTAQGDVLEIGSFRGRSTIALAHATSLANEAFPAFRSRVIAVDPLLDDDPLMQTPLAPGSAEERFERNLQQAGVRDQVEFHRGYSYELARSFDRPLRLLWIDGDHSYPSSKQDYDLFAHYLVPGGMLAMHDVLSRYDGCIRVFLEDVLSSPHFGAVGLCGSIGWAQFLGQNVASPAQQRAKQRLSQQLKRLVPYHCHPTPLQGWDKLKYQWLRSRVPHQAVDPADWQRRLKAA
jgi:hypothetical protein